MGLRGRSRRRRDRACQAPGSCPIVLEKGASVGTQTRRATPDHTAANAETPGATDADTDAGEWLAAFAERLGDKSARFLGTLVTMNASKGFVSLDELATTGASTAVRSTAGIGTSGAPSTRSAVTTGSSALSRRTVLRSCSTSSSATTCGSMRSRPSFARRFSTDSKATPRSKARRADWPTARPCGPSPFLAASS